MKHHIKTMLFLLGCTAMLGCEKYDTDYKNFLDEKEIVYPGRVSSITYKAGNLRTALQWHASPDPNIDKYVITWDNGASSMEVKATTHNPADIVSVIVPNLKEYVYAFNVNSYDSKGNKSVGREINNVRVYGAVYQSTLLNRSYDATTPYVLNPNGTLQLNFTKADSTNFSTTIRYTNTNDVVEDRELAADQSSITIPNYKSKTAITFRSSYKPEKGAIDAFNVNSFDAFPAVYLIQEMNKGLFKPMKLPTDVNDAYGWVMQNLWDGSAFGAGFHTEGSGLPMWFTFDMGQQAELANLRVWQRDNSYYAVGNLKKFEVWGSNNPNSDGSWGSWTLLTTFNSYKPSGQPVGSNTADDIAFIAAGEKFVFPSGIPAVRYIRIKVLNTWGNASYIHPMEFTFSKFDK